MLVGFVFKYVSLLPDLFGTLDRVFARPCGVLKKKRISGYIQLWTVNDVHAVHKYRHINNQFVSSQKSIMFAISALGTFNSSLSGPSKGLKDWGRVMKCFSRKYVKNICQLFFVVVA